MDSPLAPFAISAKKRFNLLREITQGIKILSKGFFSFSFEIIKAKCLGKVM
jgi:hypothetical protein